MISKDNKYRFKQLAGIIQEGVRLVSDAAGRSDNNTLSYYVEEYLLNTCSMIITRLDQVLSNNGYHVAISQGNTKMQENSLATKIIVSSPGKNDQSKEYLITAMVNFEQGANTAFSVSHGGLTEKFNLNSKHTSNDVALFSQEIITYFSNSLKSN